MKRSLCYYKKSTPASNDRSFAPRSIDAAIPWSPTQLCSFYILKASVQLNHPVYMLYEIVNKWAVCQKLAANSSHMLLNEQEDFASESNYLCRVNYLSFVKTERWSCQRFLNHSDLRLNRTVKFPHLPVFNHRHLRPLHTWEVETSWISCRSPWAFRNCKNGPCERRRACARHVAKCQASNGERPRRLGGRQTCVYYGHGWWVASQA